MCRQLNGERGDFGAASGIRFRCLDRARPDGEHLQAVIGELNFGRGFARVNRASRGHLAAGEAHLNAIGGQDGIERGGQPRGQILALWRVRGEHHVGGELRDELAKRLAKRLAGVTGQGRGADEMHLGRAQLAKRPGERLEILPSSDGVNLCLAKQQAKQLPRGFAELSVFVFGND